MRRINLNSYFALNAILNCPTLTDAGRSINLSQPAMSLALKRLRDLFADELVRYEHGKAVLSPLALQLQPKVGDFLALSHEILAMSRAFDPATDTRTLYLAAPQVILHFLMPTLLARLAVEAPNITLQAITLSEVGSALRPDISIVPEWRREAIGRPRILFREQFACLVHSDVCPMQIDEGVYLSADHVALPDDEDACLWPERSAARGLLGQRRVAARARTIDALPHLVMNRRLVATTTMRIAQQLAATTPWTGVIAAPAALDPVTFCLQAPAHRAEDPAVRWLMAEVEATADGFTTGGLAHLRRK